VCVCLAFCTSFRQVFVTKRASCSSHKHQYWKLHQCSSTWRYAGVLSPFSCDKKFFRLPSCSCACTAKSGYWIACPRYINLLEIFVISDWVAGRVWVLKVCVKILSCWLFLALEKISCEYSCFLVVLKVASFTCFKLGSYNDMLTKLHLV